MQRIAEHRKSLARILNDDRLSPNRRLLAAALAMYIDSDAKPHKNQPKEDKEAFDPTEAKRDKEVMRNILISTWGTVKNIQWLDPEDPVGFVDPGTRIELDAKAEIKNVFDQVLNKPKEK